MTNTRASHRLTNRETETVNQQLQKNLKLFLENRKLLCTLEKGSVVVLDPDKIIAGFTNVNANWKKFATIWNKTGGHTVKADHTAFARYVDQFAEEEARFSFVEELKRIVEDMFGCKLYTDVDYTAKLQIVSNEKGIVTIKQPAGEAAVEMIQAYFAKLENNEPPVKLEPVIEAPKHEGIINFLKRCNRVLFAPRIERVMEHNFPTGYMVKENPVEALQKLPAIP